MVSGRMDAPVHTYIHACMHIYKHTYTNIHAHEHVHACTRTCIYAFILGYTHTYKHTYMHSYMHYACLKTFMHTRRHINVHTVLRALNTICNQMHKYNDRFFDPLRFSLGAGVDVPETCLRNISFRLLSTPAPSRAVHSLTLPILPSPPHANPV